MDSTERAAAIAALDPMDRLSFLIGQVCRSDVWLEFALRGLWQGLVGGGPAVLVVPTSLDPLAEQCAVMLPQLLAAPTDERLLVAGLDAIASARVAHRERNRVVHDMWFANAEPGDAELSFAQHKANRFKLHFTMTPKSLSDVEDALANLDRAMNRVVSLRYAIPPWSLPPLLDPESFEQQVRTVEDRFDLLPGGGFSVHDE
jgi:hypothetical protein